eukprot:CAMPEP_0205922576 /NCGR_PEP_ID=MMETSP1325-20131115/14712_1 /ASSEMBLY_ACC=CAM_ASM_000708 /TAXON_ID=236786 /ORGANISM="Florenciella sp., Strain RCC1007" /LENGTH=183 /DNA_ID=CAMNT_0053290609 /DNA_START=27 /DNA_END=576 /DNA_ORIENTATION=+
MNTTTYIDPDIPRQFDFNDLYNEMKNPSVSSKKQIEMQTNPVGAKNRVGGSDTWVWNGRPDWSNIFKHLRDLKNQNREIGCCFCGAPVIGADLKKNCDKYSSAEGGVVFSLHKENFRLPLEGAEAARINITYHTSSGGAARRHSTLALFLQEAPVDLDPSQSTTTKEAGGVRRALTVDVAWSW